MVRELLEQYGITPDPERSQYFLHNELIVDRMIEEADLDGHETVLEIGAGLGTITTKLAEHVKKVVAYENDEQLLPALRQETEEYDNIEIKEKDFTKDAHGEMPIFFDICIANIPFHLSSDIFEFLRKEQKPAVVLVQDEFAKKLVATPGSKQFSKFSVETHYYLIPVYVQQVMDINFTPVPDHHAALMKVFPRKDRFDVQDEKLLMTTINALFMHNAKKVRNAFYNSRHMFDIQKEDAKPIRDELPHAEDRVEKLPIEAFIEIANFLYFELY